MVIGAGIGGLTAAIALDQAGWDVQVYDQIKESKPVGAAISLWPNGVKALNYLGLGDQIAKLGGLMDSMAYRWLDGRTMCEFSLEPVTRHAGQRPYPVARAELQSMLMDALGMGRIQFGMRMTALADDGEQASVTFASGERATADLVVAADGARSTARAWVTGREMARRYTGYVNFNALVDIDERVGPARQWTTYVGEGKRVSVMPVAGGRFYTFFDVPLPLGLSYDRAQARAVLAGHFGHWAEPVQVLIGQLDPMRVNRVEILDLDPFATWVRGRVALLGDAAHNTAPDIGQGGCSAMEDSVVLARLLRTTTIGVPDSLQRYQALRHERAGDLVLRARKRAGVTHGADPAATQAWYDELWEEDGTRVIRGITANIDGSPLD